MSVKQSCARHESIDIPRKRQTATIEAFFRERIYAFEIGYFAEFRNVTGGSGKQFTEYVNYRPESLDSDAFRIGTVWAKGFFRPFSGHLAQFSYARQQADHVLYPYLQMDALYDDSDRINAGYQINNLSGFVRSFRVQAYFTEVDHWMTDQYRTSSVNLPREYSMGTLAGTQALGGKIEAMLNSVTVGIEAFHREWDATTRLAGADRGVRHRQHQGGC